VLVDLGVGGAAGWLAGSWWWGTPDGSFCGARSNMSMLARGSRGARPPSWGLGAKPGKLRGTWQ